MRATQLRAFHLVAREGSFSAAADHAGLTQPALTIQVRNLEKTYGLRLYDRTADGVRMTPAGDALFRLTRELYGVQDRIAGYLSAARDLETGDLRLSADGPHLATKLIAAFRSHFPGVHISLSLGNASAVWDDLAEGRADAVVAADAPKVSANYIVPVQQSRLAVLVDASHALSKRRKISVKDLAGQSVVVRERRSNTQRMVNGLLRKHGVVLGNQMELGSREAVVEAVAASLGIGFIFASEVTPDPRVNVLELTDASVTNKEVAACLHGRRGDNIVKAFMQVAAEWRKSHG